MTLLLIIYNYTIITFLCATNTLQVTKYSKCQFKVTNVERLSYNCEIFLVSERLSYNCEIFLVSKRLSYNCEVLLVSERLSYNCQVLLVSVSKGSNNSLTILSLPNLYHIIFVCCQLEYEGT